MSECCQVTHSRGSCWSKYLCTPEEAESEEDSEDVIDRQQRQCNNVINRCDLRRHAACKHTGYLVCVCAEECVIFDLVCSDRKRKWTDNWTSEQVKRCTAATGVLMMSLFSKILILPLTVTPVQSDETKIANNQNQRSQS